jgi:hypothetical protein
MKIVWTLALEACLVALGACGPLYGDDELSRYAQRSDKVTLSAGDAKDVNATTHTIDPWPPGVTDRRIPANGERMVRAIERYRKGPARPPTVSPDTIGAAAAAGAAAGAGAAVAPGLVPTPGPGAGMAQPAPPPMQ